MKKMRRILSIMLATMMVMAMGITASATASNVTIDVPADVKAKYESNYVWQDHHDYEVYQLLTGKYKTVAGKQVITEAQFGAGLTDAFQDLYNKDAYKFLEYVNDPNGDKDKSDALTGDQMLALIQTNSGLGTAMSIKLNKGNSFAAALEQGYYLIKDTDKTVDEEYDGYTKYILLVVDQATEAVVAKMDIPEVIKKVKETNDTTGSITNWQDGADYDIGDRIPFLFKTKITDAVDPKTGKYYYDEFESYELTFVDNMSRGLTFDPASLAIYVGGTYDDATGTYDKTGAKKLDDSAYTMTAKSNNATGAEFRITIPDTKDAAVGAKAGDTIVVEFEATLNENAIIGSMGNPNKVYLEFSNNPYDDSKGKTPEDKVIVFTYKLDVNKVDKEGKELKGAGFTLYKEVPSDYVAKAGETIVEIDVKRNGNTEKVKYLQIGNEVKGVTTFEFKGIDAGNYRLVETTVPTGYNKAEDITFTIEAIYDTNSDDPKLQKLNVINVEPAHATFKDGSFQDYLSKGLVETDVINKEGLELPETGGIGTTIFYVIGAALMVGAGVVLVTRRRMAK